MNETGRMLPTILRLPEVIRTLGLSKASVYRMVKAGTFPQSVRLGANTVGWLRTDVEQWVSEKAGARDGGAQVLAA